jgi:hypothetical protein
MPIENRDRGNVKAGEQGTKGTRKQGLFLELKFACKLAAGERGPA